MSNYKRLIPIILISLVAVVGVVVSVENARAQVSGGAIQISVSGSLIDVAKELTQLRDILDLTGAKSEELNLGGTPGDEVSGNRWCVGGVCTWSYGIRMKAATTTACSVRSPAATTSLVSAIGRFNTASTSAYALGWGTDPDSFNATTTLISNFENFGAGIQVTYQASSTAAVLFGSVVDNSDAINILAPNTYVNLNIVGGPAEAYANDGFTPDGKCVYEFLEV